jgi:hypothetical protein
VLSRRDFLRGVSLLPLAGLLPRDMWETAAAAAEETFAFLTAHEAAVVREATARIIPGPLDDPLEAGHPGAREANVARYVDVLLSALDQRPERIYAGGPFGAAADRFVGLTPQQRRSWTRRIAALKRAYREGVVLLDTLAGGNFAAASASDKDRILVDEAAGPFVDILYTHAVEGTYSNPIYGGNAGRSGWTEIKFPGPSQPRGYNAAEVGEGDGLDPVDPTGAVGALLEALNTSAAARAAATRHGR